MARAARGVVLPDYLPRVSPAPLSSARPRLFLVDGYALIYRAFFAMMSRPLRTSRGENTSAVWGVTNFLLRLLDEHHPAYLAWVHDAGTSFRHQVYPQYKATREKLDEELQQDFDRSIERIRQLLGALRVQLVAIEGYEADDVIGTLAAKAVADGLDAVVVSGDKDFYQLIGPHITLLNPGRGGPAGVDEQWVDESSAADRLGVPADRVIDYLALVGDSSDNIPGVRGIGDKTARQLISEFGDLDSILAHAAEVPQKRAREALLEGGEAARLSRQLVSIRRDVPLDVALADLKAGEPDPEALRTLFAELEFHTLLEKLGGTAAEPAAAPAAVAIAADRAVLAELVHAARATPGVGLATITDGDDPVRSRLVGIAVAVSRQVAWYVPVGHEAASGDLLQPGVPARNLAWNTADAQPLKDLLADPGVAKAGHDVKRDWLALRRAGAPLAGVNYDSMLASFVVDPGKRSHDLAAVVAEQLGRVVVPPTALSRPGKEAARAAEQPVEAAARVAGEAARLVLELRDHFAPRLAGPAMGTLLADIEIPLIEVLVDMEWRGIAIDRERLAELSREFGSELQALERDIHREAGTEFNINSTPQLRHILFEKLQLPVVKKTKTGASTDADVLAQLAEAGYAVPRLLLEYRELSKLRSTYVDVLPGSADPQTGRIHTRFNQTGAATGRLSSSDPNLQNIPIRTRRGEEIRRCFVASPGTRFVVADYSQIELRLLAHFSEDPAFIGAFERGGDIHRETAALIFDVPAERVTSDMRARAKTINFATIYGQGPFALSRQLGITQEQARDFIRRYFERFAGVRRYLDAIVDDARRLGYVETIRGRRRYIPELRDTSFSVRAFGERTAMNSPLQGSAADLIKVAMIGVARSLRAEAPGSGMVLQIHDELIIEAPDPEVEAATRIVRREMEAAAQLRVPLVVSVGVGANWLDAKA